jgi:formylglycine-generating enzyme
MKLMLILIFSIISCTYLFSLPDSLSISINNSQVVLSFPDVPGAVSYKVEGSDLANNNFSDITSSGSFTTNEGIVHWSQPIPLVRHFYRIRTITHINNPLLYVEGGVFSNGTATITLSSFYLSKYEVTQHAYQSVMGANPSNFQGVFDGPVNKATWFNAIEYCNRRSISEGITPCYTYGSYGTDPGYWPAGWNIDSADHLNIACNWTANGYRLPTEMEWMFAARGGNLAHDYVYSGSDSADNVAWYVDNSGSFIHSVGLLQPNELGIFDMSGNVWEWCWDISAYYTPGSQTNPTGPTTGTSRVLRSGCYASTSSACMITKRYDSPANSLTNRFGFRVCRRYF